LRLPGTVTLRAPDNFEGDSITATIRVRSSGELKVAAEALTRAAAREQMSEIFELL
jgi:hypothetical protein